jgi:hypothetical protein
LGVGQEKGLKKILIECLFFYFKVVYLKYQITHSRPEQVYKFCENKMELQFLTSENLPSLVGKTITWAAPAYRNNEPYGGVCKITAVDMNERRPIKAETIEGDEIWFAFQDEFNPGHISYSDSDRFVSFEVVQPKYVIKHSTKGYYQKLENSTNWLTNTENSFRYATRYFTISQAEAVAKTLTSLDGTPLRRLEIKVLNAPHQPFKFENAVQVKEVFNL